jgi:hypothetical protein
MSRGWADLHDREKRCLTWPAVVGDAHPIEAATRDLLDET